jgi:hypothetical protein
MNDEYWIRSDLKVCPHHWVIDNETGIGTCCHPGCGATRQFSNTRPTHFTFDGMGKFKASKRQTRRNIDDEK